MKTVTAIIDGRYCLFNMECFNPDFAFEIVMRVSNVMQIGVSGYFLAEKIVICFEVKKCSEILSCAAVESRNRFSTAKSGFNVLSVHPAEWPPPRQPPGLYQMTPVFRVRIDPPCSLSGTCHLFCRIAG